MDPGSASARAVHSALSRIARRLLVRRAVLGAALTAVVAAPLALGLGLVDRPGPGMGVIAVAAALGAAAVLYRALSAPAGSPGPGERARATAARRIDRSYALDELIISAHAVLCGRVRASRSAELVLAEAARELDRRSPLPRAVPGGTLAAAAALLGLLAMPVAARSTADLAREPGDTDGLLADSDDGGDDDGDRQVESESIDDRLAALKARQEARERRRALARAAGSDPARRPDSGAPAATAAPTGAGTPGGSEAPRLPDAVTPIAGAPSSGPAIEQGLGWSVPAPLPDAATVGPALPARGQIVVETPRGGRAAFPGTVLPGYRGLVSAYLAE